MGKNEDNDNHYIYDVDQNITSSIGHSLSFNKLDNNYNPKNGYATSINQTLAGIGGNAQYFRTELGATIYKDKIKYMKEETVFRFHNAAGHLWDYGTHKLRKNEKFFVSSAEMRGFENGGIGPRKVVKNSDNTYEYIPLGGTFYLLSSAQLNFPLDLLNEHTKLNFRGAFFIDAGTLFGGTDKMEGTDIVDDHNMRLSAGAAIVWISPMGPMRLNFALPLLISEHDQEKFLSFNFGTIF